MSPNDSTLHPHPRKCWCCWEYETNSNDASNPLIRVCWGCKDPDLQWIHQICIDSFLTKLPVSPARRPRRLGLWNAYSVSVPSTSFRCTRCNDPYQVVETTVPFLQTLRTDALLHLRLTVPALVLAAATVIYFISVLGRESVRKHVVSVSVGGTVFAVPLSGVALMLLLYCAFAMCYGAWIVVDVLTSQVRRNVKGLPSDEGTEAVK
ncbi:hypothetical protein BC830DRAFT_1167704 [Chytriomyces sp. MP71]|nr:hypothetical protein BC830DRAFT_1167704 [Chytriomyces sp. MP71]